MTGAMYAAVAGLKAHMSALNVIGQNISNVNTNAYKATRYTFLEALYTTVRGGSNGSNLVGGKNPAQNGYGSSIGTIDLDMSTKNYTPTGMATDVMIDGDGFLIVGDKTSTFGATGNKELKDMYLTRLGNLEIDPNGYLVDGQGQVVYGFLSVANPIYATYMTPSDDDPSLINLDGSIKDGKSWPVPDNADGTPGTIEEGYYVDEDGQLLKVTNAGTDAAPRWETTVIDQYTPAPVLTAIRIPMQDENGRAVYPSWDTDPDSATRGQIVDGEGVNRISRDSVSIDENTGRITCTTAKGEAVVIGTIAIAKVENPNGVTHVDGHYYQALEGAGDIRLCSVGNSVVNSNDPESPFYEEDPDDPNATVTQKDGEIGIESGGGTKLISGGLESSGTDLATEISNMIMIQRGYQANTRIVTVTDSMLEELVNMKR